jgi:tryptophan synthase alpha chain
VNKINTLFRQKQRDILSVYFTAGYPRLHDTIPVIRALDNAGIDIIEIGIPFSDPVADGPVIQHANTVALRGGMTLALLLQQLATIAGTTRAPLVLMTYLNPLLQHGLEPFCAAARHAGISGLIIPDLPPDAYKRELRHLVKHHHLAMIPLVAPTTPPARVRQIDAIASGFVYLVSSAAVTGTRDRFDHHTIDYFRRARALVTRNPLLVGFGISNKTTLDAASQHSNGVIIGSKFISLLETLPPDQATRALLASLTLPPP